MFGSLWQRGISRFSIGVSFAFFSALIVMFATLASVTAFAHNHEDNAALLQRLNKIFFWEMANHLDLDPVTEKKMEDLVNDIQNRRQQALKQRDESMGCLKPQAGTASASSSASLATCLDRHIDSIRILARLDAEEFEKLRTLLGDERLARFLTKRFDLIQRVRSAIQK